MTFVANASDTLMTQALTRAVGDRITVDHSLMGHTKDYTIVGIHHTITGGEGNEHRVIWVLRPLEREQFWLLEVAGFSELNDTTALAL